MDGGGGGGEGGGISRHVCALENIDAYSLHYSMLIRNKYRHFKVHFQMYSH